MGRKKPNLIPGEDIKAAREAAGLTQPQLAEKVGTDQRQISKIELGLTKGGDIKAAVVRFLGLRPKGALSPSNHIVKNVAHLPNGNNGATVERLDLPVHMTREAEGGLMRVTKTQTGTIVRPSYLVDSKKAYAIDMAGDTMRSRFRHGETLYVNPELPVRVGFEYVFYTPDRATAQVRYLVKITDTEWRVRQTTPELDSVLLRAEWPVAEGIAGTKIPR